jgi:hypothetical protein
MASKTAELYCSCTTANNENVVSAIMMVTESIVRSIVAADIPGSRDFIDNLSSPIARGILREIETPLASSDFRKIEFLLSIGGQIIRFCDIPKYDEAGNHILTGFITSLWPQLQLLEQHPAFSRNDVIRQSVFNIYSRCLLSVDDLVVNHVPVLIDKIVATVAQATHQPALHECANRGIVAALQCGKTIVEVLSSQKYAGQSFINTLQIQLDGITWTICEVLRRCTSRAGDAECTALRRSFDPEAFENYFNYVYNHMLFCPVVLSNAKSLPQLLESVVLVLATYNEREVVRGVLQVVQGLFVPVTQLAAAHVDDLRKGGYMHGAAIVNYIFQMLDSSTSAVLASILGDTLYAILSGCEELPGSQTEVREWISLPLRDPNRLQRVPLEMRETVFNAIFRLSVENKRRFKSLVQDIGKVCAAELTAEDLLAYES